VFLYIWGRPETFGTTLVPRTRFSWWEGTLTSSQALKFSEFDTYIFSGWEQFESQVSRDLFTSITTTTTVLRPLYRQSPLAGTPGRSEGLCWSSFKACMPLLLAISAFGLGRRRYSCSIALSAPSPCHHIPKFNENANSVNHHRMLWKWDKNNVLCVLLQHLQVLYMLTLTACSELREIRNSRNTYSGKVTYVKMV